MKGPSGRAKFDVRRVWECPVCLRREKTAGQIVSRICTCQTSNGARPRWMRLIEEKAGADDRARQAVVSSLSAESAASEPL